MERSFGLFFYLKRTGPITDGEIPVYLRVTVDGKSCDISVKRKCAQDRWISAAGKMSGKGEAARLFNANLDTLKQKVLEAKRQLIELDKELTAESIKNLLLGIKADPPGYFLMKIFAEHNRKMASLVGKDFAAGTLERYNTSYKHTLSFIQTKYQISDINISKLNFEFITEYEYWLKSVRNCDHNTAIKYLANFRKIINICLRNGWLQRDPFLGFNMAKREVQRTALTELELAAIANKKFRIERLEVVRDIFLFSCFSGLSYADVKKLRTFDIGTGVDGNMWIITKRQKTNTSSRIPLLPRAVAIIRKYEQNPAMATKDDFVLPVLSNQKMNAYLKEIGDMCGIYKNLTFHLARHTFATTVTLSNGVPMETVSKMLGHRNIKTTQHYAKILDFKIGLDMKYLYEKYKE